jgi:hypothetical protein
MKIFQVKPYGATINAHGIGEFCFWFAITALPLGALYLVKCMGAQVAIVNGYNPLQPIVPFFHKKKGKSHDKSQMSHKLLPKLHAQSHMDNPRTCHGQIKQEHRDVMPSLLASSEGGVHHFQLIVHIHTPHLCDVFQMNRQCRHILSYHYLRKAWDYEGCLKFDDNGFAWFYKSNPNFLSTHTTQHKLLVQCMCHPMVPYASFAHFFISVNTCRRLIWFVQTVAVLKVSKCK